MGLREDTFQLDNQPAPLVLHDFMVSVWHVYNFIQGLKHLYSPELISKVTKAVWAIRLNRGPDMLPIHDYRQVIVSDKRFVKQGVYWRGIEVLKDERIEACWEEYCESKGIEVKDIPTGYKGNRRDKDDGFFECHQIGWEYAKNISPLSSKKAMKLTTGLVHFTEKCETEPTKHLEKDKSFSIRSTVTGLGWWMNRVTFGGRTLDIQDLEKNTRKVGWRGSGHTTH